jgi:hypothetical protein
MLSAAKHLGIEWDIPDDDGTIRSQSRFFPFGFAQGQNDE